MNPRISYHGGHSGDLCDHARDTKTALIESYVACRFTHVGITEHLPPPDDTFLYPSEIEKGHNAAYLQHVFDQYQTNTRPLLRRQFGDKLHLTFSFETEWYGTNPANWLEVNIENYHPDYLVASVHHVDDIPIDMTPVEYQEVALNHSGVDGLYQTYYDRQYALFNALAPFASQIPIVVAHFDLIKLFSPDHEPSLEVWKRITRNLEFAVANDFVFEVNARAFKKGLGEPYPSAHLLNQIRNIGGDITLGDDSHAVDEVGLYFSEALDVIRPIFDSVMAFEWQGENLNKVDIPLF